MTTNNVKKSIVREALPKPNVLQLSEYDITQKIMDSLTNACHRSVLFSIIENSKDAPKNGSTCSLNKSSKRVISIESVSKSQLDLRVGSLINFMRSLPL